MSVIDLHLRGCLWMNLNIISPLVLSVKNCSQWVFGLLSTVIDTCLLCSIT